MKAREEKTCEPSERGVLPSCPHHLPSSYLFLFVLCYSLLSAESFGKKGREERGEGRDERARDGRQRERERERDRARKRERERERLKKSLRGKERRDKHIEMKWCLPFFPFLRVISGKQKQY